LTHADAPAIRKIVDDARSHPAEATHARSRPAEATHAGPQNYRFSSLIVGITKSTPFLMRTSE
jgi:hypothetical protein